MRLRGQPCYKADLAPYQVLLILLTTPCAHVTRLSSWRLRRRTIGSRSVCAIRGRASTVLPHIFERFYRGEVSRSGVSTGLGLAIAKELIEAQGGAISVESQIGQAACSP